MEVVIHGDQRSDQVANSMVPGQVMVLSGKNGNSDLRGTAILRTYDGFVCLDNPTLTWGPNCTLLGRILPVGTKITLLITE